PCPTLEGGSAPPPAGGDAGKQQNGGCKPQGSVESVPEDAPAFEKLSPYPTPSPPHPIYPGRKVIEFSEDKVRIPKNSPLPNCTYATRQAISLSLVQSEDESCDRHRTLPGSPASEGSPFSSPPQIPSAFASSASSEEDLLANWQRVFVDKAPPSSERALLNRTAFGRDTAPELQKRFSRSMQELGRAASAYSDGEESAQTQKLLQGGGGGPAEPGTQEESGEGSRARPPFGRPHRSPKRMGVHHLHRKDSLTQAQEQGNLLTLCQGLCAPFFWGGPRLALVPLWGFPFWVGPPGVFFFLA
uniref:Tight junction-associated protein 1 domain-containing protein n=1 Tax=Anas platyrhynchos platyrhynchos TaxID=8840 RepID=A0A493SX72_ANAPP